MSDCVDHNIQDYDNQFLHQDDRHDNGKLLCMVVMIIIVMIMISISSHWNDRHNNGKLICVGL